MRAQILFILFMVTWSVVQGTPLRTSVVRISYIETKTVQEPPRNAAYAPTRPPPSKGEYNCGPNGSMLCKLKPGEIPKGCNGICQYPI